MNETGYEPISAAYTVLGMENHKPAMDPMKIKLAPGWYLLKRYMLSEGGEKAESGGGIVLVLSKDEQVPNVARVIKRAEVGCKVAEVGDYVVLLAFGGNEFDDRKPQPLVRVFGDAEQCLWLIHEDNIPAAIPHEG